MMQAYREVEEFFIRFPNCFLAQKWKSTITSYMTPVALKVIAHFLAEFVVTLAHATSSSNVTSMSVLQTHDI
jgi:hypothetical protein